MLSYNILSSLNDRSDCKNKNRLLMVKEGKVEEYSKKVLFLILDTCPSAKHVLTVEKTEKNSPLFILLGDYMC